MNDIQKLECIKHLININIGIEVKKYIIELKMRNQINNSKEIYK